MKNLYFFSGEKYQRQQAIKKKLKRIKEAIHSNIEEIHLDGEETEPSSLVERITATPLFAKTKLIWVKNTEHIPDQSKLAQNLYDRSFADTYLIFESTKRGKEVPLYELVKKRGAVKHFASLTRKNLPTQVKKMCKKKGVKMTKAAFGFFTQLMEVDLQRVEKEITKLSWYANGKQVTKEEVGQVVFTRREKNIFQFLDAIGNREGSALQILKKLLGGIEEPGKIFFMLANHIRSLLMIKSMTEQGFTEKEISARTGQFGWLVKKKKGQANHFSEAELIDVIHHLHREDFMIKRGKSTPETTLYKIILSLMGSKER